MQKASPDTVFLNIPYDHRFRRLYLAYISGLLSLGLEPRVTLGIPGGERRLDRILDLIKSCRHSVHDLSRVQLDRTPPRTPRFNMPFELGLAVAWAKQQPRSHNWHVFETMNRRLHKSLSDLDGTDANIHDGTIEGVMRELCNAFVRPGRMPSVPQLLQNYRVLVAGVNEIQIKAGASSPFTARVFQELCFAARVIAVRAESQSALRNSQAIAAGPLK